MMYLADKHVLLVGMYVHMNTFTFAAMLLQLTCPCVCMYADLWRVEEHREASYPTAAV